MPNAKVKAGIKKILQAATRSKFPARLAPMLATLTRSVTTDGNYIHEIKIDGYRIIAYLQKGKARLDSRSGLNYSKYYPSIVSALQKLNLNAVLDGEVCAINEKGIPDFDALQANLPGTRLKYFVFDLLWLDGYSLLQLPLRKRKELLKQLVKNNSDIIYSAHFRDGNALFEEMKERGMEGIVSKRSDSLYQPGIRGKDWLKTPTERRQEFVIGGWVESEARTFRTLLFGAYEGTNLRWVGHAGGGFKEKEMPAILKKLKSLEIKQSPFSTEVEYDGKVHWIKPQLVANFKFAGFTKSGRIRKPAIFLGFRSDKKPGEVVNEAAKPAGEVVTKLRAPAKRYLNEGSNWKKVDAHKIRQREQVKFGKCSVELSDVDRELWQNVPKARLIEYYHSVAPFILPHIQHRPQSLNLKLINAGASTVFIKDMENRQPACADIFTDTRRVPKQGKRKQIDYLVCNNEETLLYMVNLGCVDINPWASTVQHIEESDYIWIDLDPTIPDSLTKPQKLEAENRGFQMAVDAAIAAKGIFEKYGLRAFVKTSGKTGMHIYLPCEGFTFDQARIVAYRLCDKIHDVVPAISTRNESKAQRGNKVYIDGGQNDYADTLASPYSVRPYHSPTVSTPLEWKEIKSTLDRYQFTIDTIAARLKKKGDVFKGVLSSKFRRANSHVLKKLL